MDTNTESRKVIELRPGQNRKTAARTSPQKGSQIKFLVTGAVVLCFLYFMTFSQKENEDTSATTKSDSSPCLPGETIRRTDTDLAALLQKVQRFIGLGRSQDLLFWASCDFKLLQQQSQQQVKKNPVDSMPMILLDLKNESFQRALEEVQKEAGTASVSVPTDSGRYQLLFQMVSGRGWSWVGVSTQNEKTFRHWLGQAE